MEKQFFDIAGGWDQSDTMVFCFYEATSKVALGDFPIGTKFSSVWFDYEEGTLVVYKTEDETSEVKFRLTLHAEAVQKETV